MDITTPEGIQSFLSHHGYSCTSVEELTGGNANFVWRIRVDGSSDVLERQDLVVKHAENWIRKMPSLSLPAERMDGEVQMLQKILTLLESEPENALTNEAQSPGFAISIPKIHFYESKNHVMIMNYGGNKTLKDAYDILSGVQARSIGTRLAKWLSVLHARTKYTYVGKDGNRIAREAYRHPYSHLQETLEQHGLGGRKGELGAIVDRDFGSLLAKDDECVAHGDFWPGNIILNLADLEAEKHVDLQLTIVDWEMTRRGIGATDVAQFAAEAYLLDRFRNHHYGLAATFLRQYFATMSPTEEFLKRFAVHWGTHLCFWPSRVTWGNTEETKTVAEVGSRIIEMAMADQAGWIKILMDELDQFAIDE